MPKLVSKVAEGQIGNIGFIAQSFAFALSFFDLIKRLQKGVCLRIWERQLIMHNPIAIHS